MTLLRIFFLLLLIGALTYAHAPHRCEHSKISKRLPAPQVDKISPFEKRFRQANRLVNAPIRIHLDSSQLTLKGQERENILKIMGKNLISIKSLTQASNK